MRRTQTARGWTLPEMVITITLLVLVVLIGSPLFIHTTRFHMLTRTRIELQRQARDALASMTKTIRQAQSPTIVIDQAAGEPYYSRVAFTRIDGNPVVYAQDGHSLKETIGGRTRVLADNLRFLSFYLPRSDDLTILSVALTLEKAIYEGKKKALHVASEKVRVMD